MIAGIRVAAERCVRNRATALIALMLLLAACARMPTGPSVLVLAGSGKTLEQFNADDAACRQQAAQEIQSTKGGEVSAQRRYDMTYMQCMYAKGHQIPVPGTRSSGSPAGGQAAPSASPINPAQINCERSGGVWRAALNFCEFPRSDTPILR
jgi:hypothetical protein